MKKLFLALRETVYSIGGILILLAGLGIIVSAGSYLLNLFGVLSYAPPMHQEPETAVQVELLARSGDDYTVLATLTGEEMEAFLEEFRSLKARRYANDPPSPYGDIQAAIHYADGCVDRFGSEMNGYFDAAGNPLRAGGWYWFPEGTLDVLFEKYTAK